MLKLVIKIISPILYAFFLYPIVITIISIFDAANHLPDLPNGFVLEIGILLLAFLSATLILWLANILLIELEDLHKPKLFDHFRQSLFYYLLIGFAFYELIVDVCSIKYEGEGLCYFWLYLFIVVSLCAIGINAICLRRIKG